MKSTKKNKGIYLFFYIIIGLAVSVALVAGLYLAFSSRLQSLQSILVIGILFVALISFVLSKAPKMSLKMVGYIFSIMGFSILILFLYQLFVAENLLKVYMFFFGSAIVGELIMFVITLISRAKKLYMSIGSVVCVVASILVLWVYVDSSFKTVACILVSLVYLYISTLYYLDCDDQNSSEILEKSGMVFNFVALFIALYGRYTYSWRR